MTDQRPHIIVCMKVVPRSEEIRIEPSTMTIDRTGVRSEMNRSDMNALEMALALRDEHGGRVSTISMGPPVFEQYLRVMIAVGVDHAYLLSDRAFAAADTLATSLTLAKGIEKIGDYDLILCGEESSDGATAQVPPGIAEWMGIPQITYATAMKLLPDDNRVESHREIRGGHEVLSVPLPAVASVKLGVNEPRFIDMDRIDWAQTADLVTTWSIADLGIDPKTVGLDGSGTIVEGVYEAPAAERKREFLRGSPEEEAKALFERIKEYLSPGVEG